MWEQRTHERWPDAVSHLMSEGTAGGTASSDPCCWDPVHSLLFQGLSSASPPSCYFIPKTVLQVLTQNLYTLISHLFSETCVLSTPTHSRMEIATFIFSGRMMLPILWKQRRVTWWQKIYKNRFWDLTKRRLCSHLISGQMSCRMRHSCLKGIPCVTAMFSNWLWHNNKWYGVSRKTFNYVPYTLFKKIASKFI